MVLLNADSRLEPKQYEMVFFQVAFATTPSEQSIMTKQHL